MINRSKYWRQATLRLGSAYLTAKGSTFLQIKGSHNLIKPKKKPKDYTITVDLHEIGSTSDQIRRLRELPTQLRPSWQPGWWRTRESRKGPWPSPQAAPDQRKRQVLPLPQRQLRPAPPWLQQLRCQASQAREQWHQNPQHSRCLNKNKLLYILKSGNKIYRLKLRTKIT